MAGKTVIAIAHRLSTVMDMDRLIVLDRGSIVADGPHDELLKQGGLYAQLWHRQSGGFNPVARPAEIESPAEIDDLDEHPMDVVEWPAAAEESEKT
jgi:ATP-binding cassette subfamily B multidrug efflux pump